MNMMQGPLVELQELLWKKLYQMRQKIALEEKSLSNRLSGAFPRRQSWKNQLRPLPIAPSPAFPTFALGVRPTGGRCGWWRSEEAVDTVDGRPTDAVETMDRCPTDVRGRRTWSGAGGMGRQGWQQLDANAASWPEHADTLLSDRLHGDGRGEEAAAGEAKGGRNLRRASPRPPPCPTSVDREGERGGAWIRMEGKREKREEKRKRRERKK
jgi:hypothetical protein